MGGISARRAVLRVALLGAPALAVILGVTTPAVGALGPTTSTPAVGAANGSFVANYDHYCNCIQWWNVGPMQLTGYFPAFGGTTAGNMTIAGWDSAWAQSDGTFTGSAVPFSGGTYDGFPFSGTCDMVGKSQIPPTGSTVPPAFTMALTASCTGTFDATPFTMTVSVNGAQGNVTGLELGSAGSLPFAGVYQIS